MQRTDRLFDLPAAPDADSPRVHRADTWTGPKSPADGWWEAATDRRLSAVSRAVRRAVPEVPPAPKPLRPLTWKQVLGRLGIGALIGAGVVLFREQRS